MTLKVSIIIPAYNAEMFLNECLETIIQQTLTEIEIICVNDGSTDSTQPILEAYQKRDRRIRIINQANAGLSAARNAGIKLATGEYLGFVDSDDWVSLDFFEKLYKMAIENEADMGMSAVDIYFSKQEKSNEPSWINNIINTIETNIVGTVDDRKKVINTNAVWNKLFLRDFVNQHNFLFYDGLCWEDNPFTVMTSIKANKICLVRDVVYCYRIHGNSITGKAVSNRKPFDIFEIMARLKVFFIIENINTKEGYQHYYEELLYLQYSNHLFNRIHKTFKKEFFFRVQNEFCKLNNDSVKYLSSKYRTFHMLTTYSYQYFRFISNIKKLKHYIFSYFRLN